MNFKPEFAFIVKLFASGYMQDVTVNNMYSRNIKGK